MSDETARLDVRRRATPFLIALALALAALPLSIDELEPGELVVALVASLVLMLCVLAVPWWRLPYWVGAIPPLASIAIVALLRDASGASASGYSALLLLPSCGWRCIARVPRC